MSRPFSFRWWPVLPLAGVFAGASLSLFGTHAGAAPLSGLPAPKPASPAARPTVGTSGAAKPALSAPLKAPAFLDDEAEAATDIAFDLKPNATGKLTLYFDWHDAQNFYALDLGTGSATLSSTIKGVKHRLNSATLPLAPGKTTHVVLQRRPWLMRALVGKQVALTAYDATFQDGQIGFSAQGFATSDARVQPVESIVWNDDFTRLPGETGDWKTEAGTWALTSSSDTISQRNADMSANPFAFRAEPPAERSALAWSGKWFWDAYDAQVSVRPMGRGMVGFAVYVQDPKNYVAFEWDSGDANGARRLVRVVNGTRTVLAQGNGGYLPHQWYRLQARVSPDWVEVGADGQTFLRARDNWFGQGGIGLLCKGTPTFWDDARVRSNSLYRQDFSGPTGGAWSPVGGAWQAQNGTLSSGRAKVSEPERMLLAGREEWTNYEFAAQGKAGTDGACGVVLSYRNPQNYALFRWAGANANVPYKGRQQLVFWRDGKAQIAVNEPLALRADSGGMTRVMAKLSPGAVVVYGEDSHQKSANGELKPVAQAADESLGVGRCGLWAQGAAPANFRDVSVAFPPEPEAPRAATKMQDDPLMTGWASASGEWRAQPVTRTQLPGFALASAAVKQVEDAPRRRLYIELWNVGEFFGDTTLEMPWKRGLYSGGTLEATLRAPRGDFDNGVVVSCEAPADNKGLKLSVHQGSTVFKTVEVSWESLGLKDDGTNPLFKVALEGRAVALSMGDHPLLAVVLPAKALSDTAGSALALRSTGFTIPFDGLRATSYQRDDDTFSSAPVNWITAGGDWSVISRWPCYSDWSFFGGKGMAPTLWSKRVYGGDVVAEIYAHNQMDLPKELGYSHPGDLNVTLCGDGKNLWSGYQFIVAGWDNTRTRLYKGTQVVAETRAPEALFHHTMNHDMEWHRHWFDVRAEARQTVREGKTGVLLRLTMDGKTLLEFFDAQPLKTFVEGGRTAFWSLDGSLLLARARVEAREMGQNSLPGGMIDAGTPLSDATAPQPQEDHGGYSALVARLPGESGAAAWKISNAASGGTFAVTYPVRGAVNPNSTLEFDLKLAPGAQIDLYPMVDGQTYCVTVADEGRADARMPSLGRAQGAVNPGGWTHYEFDLGKALRTNDPTKQRWALEGVQMGTLTGDPYRWTGLGGNPYGASYQIRGLQLK